MVRTEWASGPLAATGPFQILKIGIEDLGPGRLRMWFIRE